MIVVTGDATISASEPSADVVIPAQIHDFVFAAGDGVDEVMIEVLS